MIDALSRHVRATLAILERTDLSREQQALTLAARSLRSLGLGEHVEVVREVFFEIERPPPPFRGMRDLSVRRGGREDAERLAAVYGSPIALIEERLARGDRTYVGELDGALLCHAWFHAGPTPFREDAPGLAAWRLERDTFWSYNAAAVPAARASGVFVKVFQVALRDLLTEGGARRVQSMANALNRPSLLLHERLGFRTLGQMTVARLGTARHLRWTGEGGERSFTSLLRPPALFIPPR